MKSVEHPCPLAGEKAFEGLKNLPPYSSGFLCDQDIKAIDLVKQFSRENDLEYKIIDLADAGTTTRLKLVIKGWAVPIISFVKEIVKGVPTKEQLESALQKIGQS